MKMACAVMKWLKWLDYWCKREDTSRDFTQRKRKDTGSEDALQAAKEVKLSCGFIFPAA
jgi:hypothetical protein